MSALDSTRRWPGSRALWLFLMCELVVFGMYFIGYARDASREPETFRSAQAGLHPTIGVLNTILLLTSSFFVAMAIEKLERDPRAASLLIMGGALLGVGFLALKFTEYSLLVSAHHSTAENRFFVWYFTLTGFHAAHVIVGLVFLGGLARVLRNPLYHTCLTAGETIACYWHMVDLLWIAIFVLLYFV